ncbi:MAG: fibro-slime domain-containing protein [Acutalibacteraceae bacterium]
MKKLKIMKRLKYSKRIIAIILMAVLLFTVASVDVSAKWLNIPDCTCSHSGEITVSHTDECAIKEFYADFCNNDADEIFRKWAFIPEDGREYILLYLSENQESKYSQLYSMVEAARNSRTVAYDAQDPGVSVYAADHAFPSGTTITTDELRISEDKRNAVMDTINGISSDITVHGFCGTNITFTDEQGAEVQPSQTVSMKLKLNQSSSLSSANMAVILHEGEDGLEVVGKVPIDGEKSRSVAVAASGFSSYYSVLVSLPDNNKKITDIYSFKDGDRLGTTKATDFYAYIGFSKNDKNYLITYDADQTTDEVSSSDPSQWKVKNRVIGREISGSYLDSAESKDLWHFQLETSETFTLNDVTSTVLNSYKITNVATGLSLDLYDKNARNSQPIDLYESHGDWASQRWFLYRHSNKGKYSIKLALNQAYSIHAYSGFENSNNNNVVLHDFASAGSDVNELFDIILDPHSQNTISSLYQEEGKTYLSGSIPELTDFYAYIKYGDKHLTFDNNGYLVVSTASDEECKDNNKYLWHFTIEDGSTNANRIGSYKILNVGHSGVIDSKGSTYAEGNVLQKYESNNTSAQRWFITFRNNKYVFSNAGYTSAYFCARGDGSTSNSEVNITLNQNNISEFDIILADSANYSTGLMRDELKKSEYNNRYSVKEFNTNLFDYEPDLFSGIDSNGIKFDGSGNNVSGENLFDPTKTYEGKTTIAENAGMEFIYDSETGYYEYKSTANHAQYNPGNNKIEQYTDTLSSYNYNSYDVPITASNYLFTNSAQGYGEKMRISLSVENGMVVGKVTGTDPYFSYKNLDIEASKVRFIYVKVYIDTRVKNDKFQLFFKHSGDTGGYESKSFAQLFELGNGDGWYEFVFDTATNPNWAGTITGLRIDPGHHFDDAGTPSESNPYTIKLAKLSLLSSDYLVGESCGAFYPLANINKAVPGQGGAFTKDGWSSEFASNTISDTLASRAIVNDTPEKYSIIQKIDPTAWKDGSLSGGGNSITNDTVNKTITLSVGSDDPYFSYDPLSVNASDVKQVRIKAKIPATVKKNLFQVFYTTDTLAEHRLVTPLTVYYASDQLDSSGYYELCFDTTNISTWSGTITNIRLDPVDFQSAHTALINPTTLDEAKDNGELKIEIKSIEFLGDATYLTSEVVKKIDLTTYSSENCTTITKNSDSTLTALVTQIDPYWEYTDLGIVASDVKWIHIRAKIPTAYVTENVFQVFYNRKGETLYSEARSFSAPYVSTQADAGGVYDIYIDVTKIDQYNNGQNWNGTISSLRIDPVDFHNPNGTDADSKNTNYYGTRDPASFTTSFNVDIYSIELLGYNSYNNQEQDRVDNLYFGMSMQYDFYMTPNKKDEIGNNITFEFAGNDDVWVFVDDTLVLDLGGIQSGATGKLDFTAGTSTVNGTSSTITAGTAVGKHTLKLFYLNRGGTQSSTFIRFNLPHMVAVSNKNQTADNHGLNETQLNYFNNSLKDTAEATYKITDGDGNVISGLTYQLADGSVLSVTDGKTFKLKNNQTAYFNIPVDTTVKVIQKDAKILGFSNTYNVAIAKDGTTVSGDTQTIEAGKPITYDFTNSYSLLRTDLTIEKRLNSTPDENTTFIYDIEGTDEMTKHIKTQVVVVPESVQREQRLINLESTGDDPQMTFRPSNTFNYVHSDNLLNITVNVSNIPTDQVATLYYYTDNANCLQRLDNTQMITVKKTSTSNELVFKVKDVIAGNNHSGIIQKLRFDPMTISDSSTVDFKINFVTFNFADGTSKVFDTRTFEGYKECFELSNEETSQVSEHLQYSVTTDNITVNSGSVKINGLPEGSYTVTERESWSWRYMPGSIDSNISGVTSESEGSASFTLIKADDNYITFNNDTTYNKWLDGNSYKQNVFN